MLSANGQKMAEHIAEICGFAVSPFLKEKNTQPVGASYPHIHQVSIRERPTSGWRTDAVGPVGMCGNLRCTHEKAGKEFASLTKFNCFLSLEGGQQGWHAFSAMPNGTASASVSSTMIC